MQVVKKTLKEQLKENEELLKTTGYRYGLKELKLKNQDPTVYEAVWGMMERVCEDACNTAVHVSASAPMGEARDACWGILSPTGEVVCCSTGIIGHFALPPLFMKWAIEQDYENDPGINDGDVFECNAPISAIHANDIYDMVPVFWEGELIAWTFGVGHTLDVGGITPGSLVMASKDCFTDGLTLIGEKIAVNDKFLKEYERRVMAFTRMGFFWLLDTRARVAGAHIARAGVLEVVQRYGVEFYKQIVKEFVEDSRRYAQARIKAQSVPGRIRRRSCKDVMAEGKKVIFTEQDKNFIMMSGMEMTVDKNARVKMSFDGTSKWLPFGVNNGMAGLACVATCVYCNMVGFEYHNSGSYGDLIIEPAPDGSFANPYNVNPFASNGSSWAGIMGFMSMGYESFSRLYYSRGFVEEVMAGTWHCPGIDIGGTNLSGIYVVLVNVEMVPGAIGARAIADGDNTAWGCIYPNADMGNVEGLESVGPYVWLSRRLAVDGGGKGKYRGGLHLNSSYMIWPSETGTFTLTDTGITNRVPHNNSLYGAYPPPIIKQIIGDGKAHKKLIDEKKEVIFGREDPRKPGLSKLGEGNYRLTEAPILFPETLDRYSIVEADHGGSAGFGDPIERDPKLVKEDLDMTFTTLQTARDVWGVEAHYDQGLKEWVIDEDATNKRRKELIDRRKKLGVPYKEWWKKSRARVMKKDFIEPLQRTLSEAMSLSPKYAQEFTELWGLPADFTF
ncbi:MAG: hydantoinase B/oxoprolinase family protein [Syntrophales bacterium]